MAATKGKTPMNTILAIAILIAGILATAGLAILALVITAIHREERRASLSEQPSTFAEILARKIMDVHVSQPEARRILAARHSHIARKTAARGAVPPQRPLAAPDPARPLAASCFPRT